MAESTNASKCAIVASSGSSIVVPSAGTDFLALQEGFSLTPNSEVLENLELKGTIAESAPTIGLETSSFSCAHYLKGSGVVATAPEENLLLKSLLGSESIAAAEYNTVASSTTTVIKVDTGEGSTYSVGEALLIKDTTNGYSVRNIGSISSDDLTIAQSVTTAPGTGVNLGRAVMYSGISTAAHSKVDVWTYLGSSAAIMAARKVQMTSGTINITAGQPVNAEYSGEGLEVYMNPIVVASGSKYIDFTTDAGTVAAVLTVKTYRDPVELAAEIQSQMDAVAGGSETITCTWNSTGASAGKFTITAAGTAVFSLLWNSGTNTANSAKTILGFSNTNDTGALTYTSDSALSLAVPATPDYDDNNFIVAKYGEVMLGTSTDTDCAELQSAVVNINNEIEADTRICAISGVNDNVVTKRSVTIDVVAYLTQYDIRTWGKYRAGETVKFTCNVGSRTGANWTPLSVLNLHTSTAKIESFEIDTTGAFVLINMTLRCFTDGTNPEFYINFV